MHYSQIGIWVDNVAGVARQPIPQISPIPFMPHFQRPQYLISPALSHLPLDNLLLHHRNIFYTFPRRLGPNDGCVPLFYSQFRT